MRHGGGLVAGLLAVAIVGVAIDQIAGPNQSNNSTQVAPAAAVNPDDALVAEIWNTYENWPGNSTGDTRSINVKGKLLARGTVPPRVMQSSVAGRLPAYLACYDCTVVSCATDFPSSMCIYFVDNPSVGRHAIMFRGKDLIGELQTQMSNDGFRAK